MRITILIISVLFFLSCGTDPAQGGNDDPAMSTANQPQNPATADGGAKAANSVDSETKDKTTPELQKNQPRTVRDFFNLLPEKYFTLEGCIRERDKNCDKARAEYVKTFLEVEDNPNGYWKSGCDGAQSCLTMALFKRPDATYVVHVLTEFEMGENSYFLEYRNGKWADIGAQIVPEYSTKNTYVPPRRGTTVEVYKKNFPEPEYSERGAKIYELAWKDGKFTKK